MAADLSKTLEAAVEEGMQTRDVSRETTREAFDKFVPAKYRNANDSFEQIQQDFRKAISDVETRLKAVIEDMKRAAG